MSDSLKFLVLVLLVSTAVVFFGALEYADKKRRTVSVSDLPEFATCIGGAVYFISPDGRYPPTLAIDPRSQRPMLCVESEHP
jgi:hypothetical protein